MQTTFLEAGDRAPNFQFNDAAGAVKSLYSEATGGPLALFFLPAAGNGSAAEITALAAAAPAMLEAGAHLFVIGADGAGLDDRVLAAPDPDGRIAAQFGTGGAALALVLDANQRILARLEAGEAPLADRAAAVVRETPVPARFSVPRHPPVLSIPRALSPEQCARLIDYFNTEGSAESGTYTLEGGKPVRKINHKSKRRHDCLVRDPALVEMLTKAFGSRIFPEIFRAFQAKMTRVEELKIVRYDADPGGYFRPHRDNTMPSNAHRRFAMTLNLNSDEYEGGRLRFPEYGGAAYKPAAGEAVVFSCSLMHEATDVETGSRYVLLTFLYDEEGEQMRQAVRRQMAQQQAGEAE